MSLSECEGELDSVVGHGEYLILDWQWLHNQEFQRGSPRYFSYHNSFLRDPGNPGYGESIKWSGKIPSSNQVLERWVLPLN